MNSKIGFFDSGLGGLYILKAVIKKLPKYDYVFLGDTKNLPYGDKTQQQIYRLTKNAVDFLYEQGCGLIIVACNTSSAQALRKIQRNYLPKKYPKLKVLGVIRPTVELVKSGDVCVLATQATVKAKAYTKELKKINPKIRVTEVAAPELVNLIESGDQKKLELAVKKYSKLADRLKVRTLILGCTHYAIIKNKFAQKLGKGVKLISQDEIIPEKVARYLKKHSEVSSKLSKGSQRRFYVTSLNKRFLMNAKSWLGSKVKLYET